MANVGKKFYKGVSVKTSPAPVYKEARFVETSPVQNAKPVVQTAPAVSAAPTSSAPTNQATTVNTVKKTVSPTVPYETEDAIRKRYEGMYNDFSTQRRAEADRAIGQYNTSFDNAQRSNYVNYMQGQRQLPEQLARQGITGGMSETANLRNRLNYENMYAGTEGQRQSAIQGVNDQYADALADYKMQADANMNTELGENRRLRSEYEQQQQQIKEERFVNNIGAYDTIGKVQSAINAAKANGETWKIPYLRQQASTIRQQGKAEKQAMQERKEEKYVNTISRYDTVGKVDSAIKAAKKSGETWKIAYLNQQKAALKQQGKAEKQSKQERYEQRYANTISGWNSIAGINKEIEKIRKSGKNTWRIAYLRARRTELRNAGETAGGSGGSSGGSSGGGGGGGRSSGGGNSKQTTTKTTKETKKGGKKASASVDLDAEAKKRRKKAEKELKKKVKQSGGMLHMGNKKTTPARPRSLAGYQDGYRYVR